MRELGHELEALEFLPLASGRLAELSGLRVGDAVSGFMVKASLFRGKATLRCCCRVRSLTYLQKP